MRINTFFLLLFLVVLSCEKDDVVSTLTDEETTNDEISSGLDLGSEITTTITGNVFTNGQVPLAGVEITIGEHSVFTDINGSFIFEAAQVNETLAYIKASKPGFFDGSRSIVPSRDKVNTVTIEMLRPYYNLQVNSGEEESLLLDGNTIVELKGAYVDADNMPYEGQVNVSLNYLNPNRNNLFSVMPGMLFGQSTTLEGVGLETYGMMEVVLTSDTGERLNIDPTSSATLRFPIEHDQQAIAPNTIPLWTFDKTRGYWKEEGIAQREGDLYVGEVSHFSWWNVDDPYEVVNVCLDFQLETGQSLSGNYIEIIRERTNRLVHVGYLGQDGVLCGKFPKDETLIVRINGSKYCTNVNYDSRQIGGFSSDTSQQIIVNASEVPLTRVTGTVSSCSGDPILDGLAYLYRGWAGGGDFAQGPIPIRDGVLDFNYSYCDDFNYALLLTDPNTGETSNFLEITMSGNNINLGTLATCATTGGTYPGHLVVSGQHDLDIFDLFDYTGVAGTVFVQTHFEEISFDAFETLQWVGENLIIRDAHGLRNIDGLGNLETIGKKIRMSNLSSLETLAPLSNVTSDLELLEIRNLDLIENLEGLENITIKNGGDLTITGNLSLTDGSVLANAIPPYLNSAYFSGYARNCGPTCTSVASTVPLSDFNFLNNLESAGYITFIKQGMTSLDGLENLNQTGALELKTLPNLTDITPLNGLIEVTDRMRILNCSTLTTLDGLESLNAVGQLIIGSNSTGSTNDNLRDFCALQNLFTIGSYNLDEVSIEGNAYNPTVQDIIDGACSN
mgnify:CR=1 FL=1